MKNYFALFALIFLVVFDACQSTKSDEGQGVQPSGNDVIMPELTTPTTLNDTDDPAIWYNQAEPSQSLILGTDKGDENGAIYVFKLDGLVDSARTVWNLKRPNNIDIEYDFNYKGNTIDIAVFTERGRNMIRVYSLPDMQAIDNGGIAVFEDETERQPMGIGLYHDLGNDKVYAIVSRKSGPDSSYLWQYLLEPNEMGIVTGKKVREFGKFSGHKEIEAIVVDDTLGYVYYADEQVGVRQYYASPDSSNTELGIFATEGFVGDQEGISILPTSKNKGYILVSDQQADKFHLFRREGTIENPFEHELVKIIKVAAHESDGSDIIGKKLNHQFSTGVFVVMSDNRTFHFYKLEDIL